MFLAIYIFRAFLVDTLLAPLIFDGKLIINSKGGYLQEIPIEMLLTGGVLDLDILEKYNFNLDELAFEVKIDKLLFSDQQLSAFMNTANTINSYYSYSEVSDLLLERYGRKSIKQGEFKC